MSEATLEQRVKALENAVHDLQVALNAPKPAPDWLDRVVGSMKDEPAFMKCLLMGQRFVKPIGQPRTSDNEVPFAKRAKTCL